MKIYYINLAHRPDRRAQIEAQLDGLGLAADRIEAVTPDAIEPETIARYCSSSTYRYQSPIELGCSLSHVAALTLLLESEDTHALILEDDVVLAPSLPSFLGAFAAAPPPIDVIHLETDLHLLRLEPKPDWTVGDLGFHRYYSTTSGSAAYIVNRRAARRIVDGDEVLFEMTDQAIFSPFQRLFSELTVRQANPGLAIQHDRMIDHWNRSGSDLEAERVARWTAQSRLRSQRWHFDLYAFIDREFRVGPIKLWHQYVRGAAKRVIPFASE